MGAARKLLWIALALGAACASAQPSQLQIQFAEKVAIAASATRYEFEAYGRHFALEMRENDRLLQGLPAARKATLAGRLQLLRGKLEGNSDSWARLSTQGGRVSGGIWDGTDLYLVARHRDVARFLTNPLTAGPDDTVVFRLADTTNFLPAGFCATDTSAGAVTSKNGLAQYKAMVREFKLTFVAAPTDQIDISLIADSGIVQAYSGPNDDVNRGMLDAINLVDGIYDSQLGLMINVADLRPLPAGADPFTSNDSSGLLGQLRSFRQSVPAVQSKAVAHLLTSRVLDDGTTLGIAYLNGACDTSNGVSLTSVGPGGYLGGSFMIIAHELGHNLGAEHDTAQCGDTHIMWPEYSYQIGPTLSQCSLDQIKPFIAAHRGACIKSPSYGDIAPRIGTIANPLQTEPFTWPVYVKNTGTAAITDAVASLSVRNYDPVNALPTQGTCAPLNGTTYCQLGTIAAGAEARIDMSFTVNYLDTLDLSVATNAANDRYESNNVVYGSVTVVPRATLTTSVTPAIASAYVGDVVEYVYSLVASGPRASRAAKLQIGGDGYLQVVSASATQGTCTTSECNLGDIPTGTTAKVTVRVKATQGDAHQVTAQTSASFTAIPKQYVTATLNATATYDLAIVSPGNQLLAVGVPFTLTIPIRANGTKPVSGGLFRMNLPGALISAFDIAGVSCPLSLLQGVGCPIDTLNPGDVRVATITATFNAPYDTGVYIAAEINNDELWTNNSVNLLFRARYGTDVTLVSPAGAGNIEGSEFDATATLRSQGANAASNLSTTFDVPVGVRVLSATLPQGACTVVTERRATCTLATLAAGDEPQMKVRLIGDEPATYPGIWTIAADNEGAPGNNSFTVDVYVGPLADVGIKPIAAVPGFVVGIPREFTIEVFTGNKRSVDNVVVSLPSSDSLVLEAISTPVGTCNTGSAPVCNLGTLAPNSLVRIVPRYRATRAGSGSSGWVMVHASRDVDPSNNDVGVNLSTYEAGDVAVRVSSTTVSGKVGDTVDLPQITIETIARSYDVRFTVTLPPSVTVASISGAAFCSGAGTLECYLRQQSEPGTLDTLDLKVRLDAAGTFTANVAAHVANDTQPANDTASVQVQATSVATPSAPSTPSTPKSGSGGGRFEWLGLAWLALLAGRRAIGDSRSPPRGARPRFNPVLCPAAERCGLRH